MYNKFTISCALQTFQLAVRPSSGYFGR